MKTIRHFLLTTLAERLVDGPRTAMSTRHSAVPEGRKEISLLARHQPPYSPPPPRGSSEANTPGTRSYPGCAPEGRGTRPFSRKRRHFLNGTVWSAVAEVAVGG